MQNAGTSGICGLYAHNVITGENRQLTLFQQGTQLGAGTAISGDGSMVAFSANDPTLDSRLTGTTARQIFTVDLATQTVQLLTVSPTDGVTPGNHDSWAPSLCTDGRYVAFLSRSE